MAVYLSMAALGAACVGELGRGQSDDDDQTGSSSGPSSSGAGADNASVSSGPGAGQGGQASASVGQGGSGPTTSTGQGGSPDPHAAARLTCINKINELRATKGAPPLGQWTGAEMCADDQATSDQASNDPHGAFGQCGESGQNECLGGGAAGIESCLESMWAEKDQAGCAGCDACADAYNPNCPNCDFYGTQTGDVCGHYVNMRALYFSEAACGFSTSWAVIDFH